MWDVCCIIFCHVLHINSGKTGMLFSLSLCSLWWVQKSDMFWLIDCIRLFVHNSISLSSLCKLIWSHWTYRMPVRYSFVKCVSKIKHILSFIHYTMCGAMCFQFTHIPWDDWENIFILSYHYHQIRSLSYNPLLRVRSWNDGKHSVSLYILAATALCSETAVTPWGAICTYKSVLKKLQ